MLGRAIATYSSFSGQDRAVDNGTFTHVYYPIRTVSVYEFQVVVSLGRNDRYAGTAFDSVKHWKN